jgi:hypothetical protein
MCPISDKLVPAMHSCADNLKPLAQQNSKLLAVFLISSVDAVAVDLL